MAIFNRKLLVILTGASRGIGHEIALQLAKCASKGSAFIITARNEGKLEELKGEILKNNDHYVQIVVYDAINFNESVMHEYERALEKVFEDGRSFDASLLIHNAATLGDIEKRLIDIASTKEWQDYLQLNLVSMIQLNGFILKRFSSQTNMVQFVINITSLAAVQPIPSLSQYAVGKAAREAYFRALAAENPCIRVFSYSPGPVRTDMLRDVSQRSFDDCTRQTIMKQLNDVTDEEDRSILIPSETVAKLLALIESNSFENGSRFDYFDDVKCISDSNCGKK